MSNRSTNYNSIPAAGAHRRSSTSYSMFLGASKKMNKDILELGKTPIKKKVSSSK